MVELLGPLLGLWLWEGTCLFFVERLFFRNRLPGYAAWLPEGIKGDR